MSFNGLAHPFVQSYKYDSLSRLTEARETSNGSQTWKQTFGYDRYGNRTGFTQDVGGQQLQINNLTLPAIDPNTNRFAANQGYTFDKNGNLIVDPVGGNRQFTFNGDNKQTEVRDACGALVAEYFYDGEGRRVKKKVYSGGVPTEETIFVYSSGRLIAEYSDATPPADPTTNYTVTDGAIPRYATTPPRSGGKMMRVRRDLNNRNDYRDMVRWFSPPVLVKTLQKVLPSSLFARYADRRLVHAALDSSLDEITIIDRGESPAPPDLPYDRSCTQVE